MEGDWNSRQALTTLRAVVSKLATAPGKREIVLISDGFLLLDDHRDMEAELIEAAVRSSVIVNALGARGLQAFVAGGDASTHGAMTVEASIVKTSYQTSEATATEAVLGEAATGTGGRLFKGSNDIEGGLERIAALPECVYLLIFSPQNLKFDGKYHNLKVTLRNGKGLTVETRRGYFAPNHKLDPKERSRDEIQAAFFSTEDMREIPTEMETQFFKTGDDATVDILAKVDLKALNFRKEAERNRNDVTIVSGLFDENGNYVSGIQKVVEMRMKDETLAARMASGISVRTSISGVKAGRYSVRMVVRDAEGQELTALSGGVEIP
jgi:sulfur transfer complex TusBCD TusB component (DsrH family)